MRVRQVSALLAMFVLTSADAATSQQYVALDTYTCSDFLKDVQEPANGVSLLRSFMMISWATGYAAAHQAGTPRADPRAVQLIAATLGNECRKDLSQKVLDAAVAAVKQLATESTGRITAQAQPIKPAAVREGKFDTYDNFDLPQGDLRRLKRIELRKCIAACSDSQECRAYSYDKWNKWCFLKSEVTALTLDPGSISGVKSDLKQPPRSDGAVRFDGHAAKAFEGSHREITSHLSSENCEQQCQQDKKCLGYTYLTKPQTCRVFTQITTFAPNKDAMSAFKTQSPP